MSNFVARPAMEPKPCPECTSRGWRIPAAPQGLPGYSIPATEVLAVCHRCGYETTLDQTLAVILKAPDEE